MEKRFKYLNFITAFFVTVLLVSNVASSKILAIGPLTFDGGTILFPLSYIFGDILTEVYGYARSRRVIWTGFLMLLLATLVFIIVGILPPAADWNGQAAYDQILGMTPRIVVASLTAYFVGEFLNAFVLAKMKVFTKGKHLWARTIGSTLFGEAADTLIFCMIAFYGILDNQLLLSVIVSNYVFKVGVEVLFTPVTYMVIGFLKKKEKEDYFDTYTNFNPLRY
jgi:queuosine precursor transporter